MDQITAFDDWIRRRRKALDLTQAQLAARVGCAVVTIKKIEQATRRPSQQMAELLADALAIPEAERALFLRMARHEYVAPSALPTIVQDATADADAAPAAAFLEWRGPSPFVGRAREMAQLDTHLTGARNGSGRIVFISGEAGRGKTTLMTEFARHALATYPDLIVAGGNSEAYAGTGNPYLPFRDILALLTGDMETPGHVRVLSQDQVRRLWTLLPFSAQAVLEQNPDLIDVFVAGARLRRQILAHPIAATLCRAQIEALDQHPARPGNVPQRRLFEQYAQLLRTLAQRQPLLLLLDDLQWIDRASADMLFHVARRLTGSRILFLGTFRRSEIETGAPAHHTPNHPRRSGHSEEQVDGRAGEHDGAEMPHQHVLTPLLQELKRRYGDIEINLSQSTPERDRAFVDALLDSEPNELPESFRAKLFQRTQGHPLFTVELLRDMEERGDLVQDSAGNWVEERTVDWEALPARVEAVISRRIGRLPAALREALKIASVEGETFAAEIIAHILGTDGWELVQQLSGVAGRQHHLIVSQGPQRLGSQLLSYYRFVHILFQDYLYGLLDAAERVYLHEAVGNAWETLAAGRTDAVAIQLARHFQAAELPDKAITYLHVAGRQAMALSAHHQAIAHLTDALALLPARNGTQARDERELQLLTDLGICYKITKGFAMPGVEEVYRRAQELCETAGDALSRACVLWGLHSVYIVRGELAAGYRPAQECLALAGDESLLHVTANSMLGCAHGHMGDVRAARVHFERAFDAYRADQHRTYIFLAGLDLGVFTLAHLAHVLCYLGHPDRALETAHAAVDLAQSLAHRFSQAAALSYLTMLHQLRGDRRAVRAAAAQTHQLCEEYDIPYYLAWSTFMLGWGMAEYQQIEEGILRMEQSLADLLAMQTGLRRPYYLGLLAETYATVGRIDDGLALIAEALAVVDEQDQRLYEPDLHRIQGQLLWEQAAPDAAVEACFRRAHELARAQDAKLMEVRAATALARLLQRQGKKEEAHGALAELVAWFSEGADTTDLRHAQAVLATLA
ncbi:MAG: AAA family ATPase [Caldilineaceae bacterium]|nr:AAA family ATPase [Caldilineaceae bacterium]